ncbi:restriction endonuclease subunit S [Acinetobacter sp. SwsAc5]|nr:restriction endonuclease subunit S [Acinetobacter sp. SwsAc5]
MDIYVPESDLLQKIDNTLDVIEQTISQTRIIIEKLNNKKQGLLNDLLTRGVNLHGNLRPSYEDAPDLYQETELGFIPKEWDISLLDDVATRGSGHTPNKNVPSYWNGGVKWVSLADSSKLDQIHISETDKEISYLGIQNSSAVMHSKGTVVLSRDAGIGKSAILTDDMAVSQHFMAWKCSKRLNNYFLYYWLQQDKPVFENIAIGSTIKTIGLPFFKTYKIAVPSISEQEKVSAILLDTDKYLSDEVNKLNKLEKVKIGLLKDLLQN